MILADSSIWIEHFRKPVALLPDLIGGGDLRIHPTVIGELALGSVPDRSRLLNFLAALPTATQAENTALLEFVETQNLYGCGIGYVDAHLLKSCVDAEDQLWTRDKRLAAQAERLGLAFED
jgi:predicted nucleic acid-binding protein